MCSHSSNRIPTSEAGEIKKAQREAKAASASFYAAQLVAARQQFVTPVAKSIAKARNNKARKFAPQALKDADLQARGLSEKLAKYEGELSDMAEVRRKLQLKRKSRLTKLFAPEIVEILLTPDAGVILRMKTLNFLSGSAVIPPEAYNIIGSCD